MIHGNLKQVSNTPERVVFSCAILIERVKQNILVDSEGHARLSDIGFSKLMQTEESEFGWAQVGATGYRWAAPEIFQKGKFTKQSDIFTYGFVAAEVRLPTRRFISP